MRLLTVHSTLDPASGGGNAARTLQLSRVLTDLGVDCSIATSRDGLAEVAGDLDGIEVVSLPTVGGRFRVPSGSLGAFRRAVRRADLLLLMNHWTVLNALAYRAARRERKPHVVCPGGALHLFGRSRRCKQLYNALTGRELVRRAAGHIAIVPHEIDDFVAYGVPREVVTVIPNGVPPSRPAPDGAAFCREHGLGAAPFFLYLGRLAPIKGPDLLLAAFADRRDELRPWRLVIAGYDEGMRAELLAAARALAIADRVHFVGFLAEGPKQQALAAADLLVLPSRRDVMSIVVLEAAAAGRPVLVTDRCGLVDVAKVGGGWVVPASVEGLAGGLVEAAAGRAELAARGQAWRRFALAEFGWPRVAALHLELFERVLGGRVEA